MPFGGKNSVTCWQRVVDDALAGLKFAQAFAYDIVIWSDGDEVKHMRRVRVVLERLHAKGVQLSPKKIKLGMHKLKLLGHVVSADGVGPINVGQGRGDRKFAAAYHLVESSLFHWHGHLIL